MEWMFDVNGAEEKMGIFARSISAANRESALARFFSIQLMTGIMMLTFEPSPATPLAPLAIPISRQHDC